MDFREALARVRQRNAQSSRQKDREETEGKGPQPGAYEAERYGGGQMSFRDALARVRERNGTQTVPHTSEDPLTQLALQKIETEQQGTTWADVRELAQARNQGQDQKRLQLGADLLHPERRVQLDGVQTIPSGVEKSTELHRQQMQTETTRQQKYGGQSYTQLKEALSALPEGEEKAWLEEFAPSVMTAADYDSELESVSRELEQLEYRRNQLYNVGGSDFFDKGELQEMDQLLDQIKMLSQKKAQLESGRKYGFLSENSDYAEGSVYQPELYGSNSEYKTVNGAENTKRMTSEEIANYNYIFHTEGEEAAKAYIRYLMPTLNSRKMEQVASNAQEVAEAYPAIADLASISGTLLGGVGMLDALGQRIVKDVSGDYYTPIDTNSAVMVPSVMSSTIRGTRAQNLAEKHGTIHFDEAEHPILSRLLNGKSWGDVYQLGMSMVDSTATAVLSPVLGPGATLLLGGSSATQTMLDAAANGATDEQALTMGALAGAFEYLFEKYELESLIGNIDDGILKALFKQSLSEGFGEGMTTVANYAADSLIMADKSELRRLTAEYMAKDPTLTEAQARKEALKDMAIQTGWDFVGGVTTGGIMGGTGAAANKVTSKLQQLAMEKVTADQEALRKLAIEKVQAEQQAQIMENTAPEDGVKYSIKRTQNMSWEEQIGGALSHDGSVVHSDTLVLDDTPATLVNDGIESKRLAIPLSVITKAKSGKDASHSIKDANLKDLQRGVRNAPIMINNPARNAIVFVTDIKQDGAPVLVAFQKNAQFDGDNVHKATGIHLQMDVATMLKALPADATVYAKNESELDTAAGITDSLRSISASVKFTGDTVTENSPGVNGENSVAEGKILRGNATVEVADIASAGGGKLTVKLNDGSTADVSELSFPDAGEQELWRVLAEYADNAEAARQLLKEYRAGELGAYEYARGVEEGFLYGKLNIGAEEMSQRGSYVNLLDPMQKNMAYSLGKIAGEKQTKKRQAEASERNAKRIRKGGVHYGYAGQTLDKSKLTKAQRVGVDFAERLAKKKGMTFYFYRSDVNSQGQRVYRDQKGQTVAADKNGWYDPGDGSIHIDLNCGDMGGTVLFTLAHELTHFIQDWSPEKYRILCGILTEGYLEMGQSVQELVQHKQEQYSAKGEELSYEQAFDEVIASSMESVLNDGRVLELLDDIEVKDKSLYEKVRSFIEDVAALVYETIQAYRDLKPDSPEGRIVQRMQGIYEQLRQVFAEGLHEGGENYRQGGKENTTSEGGVRYSITEPFVDVNGTHFDSAVLLDTAFFDGINPRDWGGKLRDFVKMRAATDPFILPVADENGNIQQLQFANPQDRVTKNGKSDHKVLDKLSSSSDNISKLAVIHIDEIVEVSDADLPYHTTDNNHQWLDQNGWLHRTANVINTKNGNIYNLTLDIAKTKDGRHILYATSGKIKRVGNVQVNSLTIRGSGQNSNSNSNIAQSDSTVKRKDLEYQYAVQNGDMNTAQKMVDEAASRAGYTIKAFHGTTNQEQHSVWNAERREWVTTYTPITVFKRQYDEQAGHFFSADKDNAGGYGSYLYSVYLMMKNPLVIECNGQTYNSITFDGKEMDTYEWADYARKRRYDGVIFKNVRDGVGYGDLSEPTTDYVVFDSNRIKSADPVTYDNNGRVIPLSERFSPVKRDIRYSVRYQKNAAAQEQLQIENTSMGEDVAGLNELVTEQRKRGDNAKLREGALQAAASVLMEKAGARGKRSGLMELLDRFYQYVGSGQEMNWDGIRKAAKPVVDWLMDHAARNKQLSEYSREVLQELRTSRIYLDETQKEEAAYLFGSFGAYRKMLMGSVTIANEGSMSLDSRWHELSQLYPDVFKEDVSAADMPRELADIINRLRNSDTSELEFEYNREFIAQDILYDVYDSYWNASTLYSVADQHERFIKSLKGKHKQRMQAVYQRQWERRAAVQGQKGLSPRELLVNEVEGMAANSEEFAKLQEYRRKIQELNATEEHLKRLDEGLRKLYQATGPRDQKQIDALLEQKQKALDKLNRYDSQIINLENTGPIRSIIARMKNSAYQRGYTKARERYQESRQRATERHDNSQMRQKLKRVVHDLWKLQETAPRDRRTKEELREFVESAIKAADLVWLERYDEYDMVRNGVGIDLRGDEVRLMEECRELLAKHLEVTEAENRWDIEGALQAAKDKAALDKELGKLMKQLRDAGVFAEEFKRVHKFDAGKLIDDLITSYEKLKGTDSPYLQGAYQEVLPTRLQQIREKIGAKPVRNMTAQELELLYEAYSAVLHVVRNANKMFADNRAADVNTIGTGVVNELEAFKRQKWSRMVIETLKKTAWNNLTPAYVFRRIGSATLERLYKNMVTGMGTYGRDIAEAKRFYQTQARKYGAHKWDLTKRTEFVDRTGKKFSLSLGQLMSLYALSKRKQALGHLEIGGIMLDTTEAYIENIVDKVLPKVMTNADTFKLDKATLEAICSKLTAEQKAFVDATQEYLSKNMSEKGNEVSMKLFGIKLFTEKHYFPLRTASQTRYESTELIDQHKLKNSGFTKEVNPQASNAVVLSDYSHVWTGHVKQMSLYHGMTLPMEDMDRILNFGKTFEKDENGNIKKDAHGDPIEQFAGDSVCIALQNIFGKHPENYIRDLMKQLNGGVRSDPAEEISGKMVGRFKKAAVAASLSVWIQQWTSVFRSMAYVPMKYFFQKPMGRQRTAIVAEMKEHCPIAIIKEMGGFDTGIGCSEHDYITMAEPENAKEFVEEFKKHPVKRFDEITGWLPAYADETTWAHIWTAVKRETRDAHPEMKMGTEEFYKVAAERFTEVINLTQVYDSVLSKSALMRSKGGLAKMVTSFMAEPTMVLNMAVDAMLQQKRTGKLQTGMALALVGSIVANAMSSALIYAMRDDDEEETFWEKYSASVLGNLLDGLNPLTYIPIVKDIWSMLQGYDVKRSDMEVWSQFVSAIEQIVRKYADEDATDKEKAEAWAGAADWALALFGVPVKNLRRELKGFGSIWNTLEKDLTVRDTTALSLRDTTQDAFWSSIPIMRLIMGETKAEKLLDAHIAGDAHYVDRLRGTYKTDDAANNAVVRVVKERFEDGKLTEDDVLRCLVSYADKGKEDAQDYITKWNFQMDHPESGLSDARKLKFVETVEPAGISLDVYADYCEHIKGLESDKDKDGKTIDNSLRDKYWKVIHSLPITKDQKDAIYIAENKWAESSLKDTPWH